MNLRFLYKILLIINLINTSSNKEYNALSVKLNILYNKSL